MDDKTLENILGQIYELEGLVMVARRDNADRDILLRSMQEKVGNISSLLGIEHQAAQPDVQADGSDTAEAAPLPDNGDEKVPAIPHEAEPTSSIVFDSGDIQTFSTEIDYKPGDATPIGLMAAVSDDDDDDNNDTPAKTAEPQEQSEYDDGKSSHDSQDEPATEMTFDYVEPNKIEQDEPEPRSYNESHEEERQTDNQDQSPLTVDDVLHRHMSRDLKRAFTLNDRFRFRRELFGNSDVEMNDALNLVETMQSYAEAEEYFYNAPMSWDKESPEVIDFMAILRNHFYVK